MTTFKTLEEKTVHPYHSFDSWRKITNHISIDVGDLNLLTQDLVSKPNLVAAINETYDSTQVRLRHVLIKSIGMS